jgi:6-phosphogluconolactonase
MDDGQKVRVEVAPHYGLRSRFDWNCRLGKNVEFKSLLVRQIGMKNTLQNSLLVVVVFAILASALQANGSPKAQAAGEYLFYVGTARDAGKGNKNIYAFRFHAANGQVNSLGVAAETVSPGSLAAHPNGRYLYATNEVGDYKGTNGGGINAFAIDRVTGKLTYLNDVFSGGGNPAHIIVDKAGKDVLIPNYINGKVGVFPLLQDGRLGEATAFVRGEGSSVNPARQEGPHPHSVYVSPDNRFAVACDLGLDKVLVYQFDSTKGSLTPNDPPFARVNPGAGPRHLAFSPDGRFVYVINELQSSVSAFSYDASRGALHPLQTISTLPNDYQGKNTGSEVAVLGSGKFLYASNRGHDSIAVFAIDVEKGTLKRVENVPTQGRTPRTFAIEPTGSYLLAANQDSDNIVVFRVDPKTGRLTPTGQPVNVGVPVSVIFVPDSAK